MVPILKPLDSINATMTPEKLRTELDKLGIKHYLPNEGLLYKYTSFESAKKILESEKLKFSSPSSFNDPFELTDALIDVSFNKEQLKNWINTIALDKNNAERRKLINENIKKPERVKKLLSSKIDKFKDTLGICCFSKSYLKALMWSHYAESHTGICLGFDLFPISLNGDMTISTVKYTSKVEPVNYFSNKEVSLFNWVFSKSHIWSYEEEVRAAYIFGAGLIPFLKNSLKEIYFGLRVTKEKRIELLNIIESKGYNISKKAYMVMDKSRYDLMEKLLK